MNPASTFRPAQYSSASIAFLNVDIQPREDGQSAVLHADVQYDYGFKRGEPAETVDADCVADAQDAWWLGRREVGAVSARRRGALPRCRR